MDEAKAREILKRFLDKKGELHSLAPFVELHKGLIELDGYFTADDLEAIVWWVRNKI